MNTGKFCFNRDEVPAYSFKQSDHCHHNSSRYSWQQKQHWCNTRAQTAPTWSVLPHV